MGPEIGETLRVQLNQIDYTVSSPGFLDNSTLPLVPIIRIYGASSTGKTACVHVHQTYPYFFVEYLDSMKPDSGQYVNYLPSVIYLTLRPVNRYIAKLTHSLNHAIAISMKRNPHSPKSQFVRAILLVKGVHFYGFHFGHSPFLKILINDPTLISRAATIMQSGTVMATRFRVFESHLSYILQFMCDFGLYGCGWIELGEVWQRGNEDEAQGYRVNADEGAISFKQSLHFRQSRMSLEVDVVSHQIRNRNLLAGRNIHDKLKTTPPSLPAEPLVPSVKELWEDERRRRRDNGLPPSPVIPVDPSEKSRGAGGEWVAEARWWEEIRKRIQKESLEKVPAKDIGKGWERWVMTTFESVEALWEEPWKVWAPAPRSGDANEAKDHKKGENPFGSAGSSGHTIDEKPDVDVDEAMLSSQEMSQLVEREEAEWKKLMGDSRPVGDEDEDELVDYEDPLDFEDGPPPDLQEGADHAARAQGSPRSKRPNVFQKSWTDAR
jgi:DNA polymerase zeta